MSLRSQWGDKECPKFGDGPPVTQTAPAPVKLSRRSETDQIAYLTKAHLEALAEISSLKADVGRLTLENAELRTRTQPVRTVRKVERTPITIPTDREDRQTHRQMTEMLRQRSRRERIAAAKAKP